MIGAAVPTTLKSAPQLGALEVHLPARALQSLIMVPGANEVTVFDTLRSPQTCREKKWVSRALGGSL